MSNRRAFRLAAATGVVVAAVAALSAGLLATGSGGAANTRSGIPAWLPKASVPVGRIVTATPAHPQLAIEGDSVEARLARGSALVTAVGPSVPEEGAFPVPPTTPCTFVVTFAKSSGTVPMNAGSFSILDEYGHVHVPAITAGTAGGHTVTRTLLSVLPTGSGTLRWAPGGGKPVVSWDFDVEID